ncbi:23S rRNA m(5)U-1939 methyltransferase [Rhizobiales bacterium GAS188]|nr:23S rRNA m(5)U-1939 methyltransferase [Rhizobiales bacterium GAS188]
MDKAQLPAGQFLIERMGPLGDGASSGPRGQLYVPFSLPGEEVTAEIEDGRLKLSGVLRPSPDRVSPICRYFGECGGCKLQHWRLEPYLAWKRGLVVEALAAHDVTAPVAPTRDAHGAGRRRVTFHARRDGAVVHTGFMRAASHRIVPIDACPILVPGLEAAARIAGKIAELMTRSGKTWTGKPLDIAMTASEAGLDVTVKGPGPLQDKMRDAAIALADRCDLARLSNHNEVMVERRPPYIAIGPCRVLPPPGAFLQATTRGEEILARLVTEALGRAKHVADLFCGIGPFALRLASSTSVDAFDSDAASVAALVKAAREIQGLKPIKAEARDLFRRPLLAAELKACDAVVLDPPRQGAEAQIRELARSALSRIVYVSCNPATFARDAAALIQGGFRLESVTPVDQFRFSAHLELVGTFRRVK